MNVGCVDMGNGEQLYGSLDLPSLKVHGSDFRSAARQRRFACITFLAALLPFVIAGSYHFHTDSDVPSEVTEFLQAQPEPAALHSNSSDTQSGNDQTEISNEKPEPYFSDEPSSNVTSTAGDEDEAIATQSPTLSASTLNTSASDPSSDVKIGSENGVTVSNSSHLAGSRGKLPSPAANGSLEYGTNEAEEEKSGEIMMKGTEALSTAQNASDGLLSEGVCDLEQGNWVPDSHPLLYNATCKYIQDPQNCHKNGRPDDGYLFWKWKPNHCELPRIDAAAFLNAMRNRSVVFAGDSIARNQFQSLLCVLSQVEDPKHTYWSEDGRNNVHHFQSFNFTASVRWSPYLVRIEEKLITWPDNVTESVRHVYLDEPDEMWVTAAVGADILQLSTGQWWYQKARYLEKNMSVGCHGYHPHCDKPIAFYDPYLRSLAHVFRGSLAIPGFNGTVVYRSFSPEHFENGNWDSGGDCIRTTPGGVPMSYDTDQMYGMQKKSFQIVSEELGAVAKKRLKLLGYNRPCTDATRWTSQQVPDRRTKESREKRQYHPQRLPSLVSPGAHRHMERPSRADSTRRNLHVRSSPRPSDYD